MRKAGKIILSQEATMQNKLILILVLVLLNVTTCNKEKVFSTQYDQYTKELLIACQQGDIQTVKRLVRSGTNLNARRGDLRGGNSTDFPLLLAAEWGHDDVFEYLISEKASIKGSLGEEILRVASRNGRIKIVNYLLAEGVSVNDGEKYYTPLMEAVRTNNIEIIKILIIHGAIIDDHEKNENFIQLTALMVAAEERHPEAIKILINSKADVNARTKNYGIGTSWSPLMLTFNESQHEYSASDHIKSIDYLLAAGADPNLVDECGCTALDYSIRNYFTLAGKHLAEKGGKRGEKCILPPYEEADEH